MATETDRIITNGLNQLWNIEQQIFLQKQSRQFTSLCLN